MRNGAIRMGLVLVVLTLGIGVGDASAGARGHLPRSSAASLTTAKDKIVDFAFKPKTLHITKGTRVKWVNKGSVTHTTTSNKGLWDSGRLAPGERFSRVFRKAGTFKFHCSIHPNMVGKIVVG
jgi:plastocyanin